MSTTPNRPDPAAIDARFAAAWASITPEDHLAGERSAFSVSRMEGAEAAASLALAALSDAATVAIRDAVDAGDEVAEEAARAVLREVARFIRAMREAFSLL